MNTSQNFSPEPPKTAKMFPGKPSNVTALLFALAAAAAAVILPELGFISAILMCAAVMFISSARAAFPIVLIPIVGAGLTYLRGGFLLAGVCAVLVIASMIAGYSLNRGGFHRALMLFTFVTFGAAIAAVALYTKVYNISAEDLASAYNTYLADIMANAVKNAGDKLSAENAELMVEQYELMMESMFLYAPVALAWMAEIGGIIALRLTGLCHDLVGSIMYPGRRRPAVVNKVFAVVYFAALVLGMVTTGVFGVCAANVMLVLLIPAATAGISDLRRSLILRRLSGKRGFPPMLLIVIVASLALSIGVGLVILAIMGCVVPFKKEKQ